MSPGWDRKAGGQLWVPTPRLGCLRHPSKLLDADSSHEAVLRQNTQQLGKTFHLVNSLWDAALSSLPVPSKSGALLLGGSLQGAGPAVGAVFAEFMIPCGFQWL